MIVVRLVVLALLGFIGGLLLRGILGRKTRVQGKAKNEAGRGGTVQDVLVEDPVCHTLVPKNQAIRLRQNDATYYFCSDACCDKFSEKAKGEE